MIRHDYKENLAKYVPNADQDKLEHIIKYCGIALRGKDSQFVATTDPEEVQRVVVGFAAKKLGLSADASVAGIKKVHEIMIHEHAKLRTTVYYLLAKETGTLGKI